MKKGGNLDVDLVGVADGCGLKSIESHLDKKEVLWSCNKVDTKKALEEQYKAETGGETGGQKNGNN